MHLTPWYWHPKSYIGGGERYVHNVACAQTEIFSDYQVSVRSLGRIGSRMVVSEEPDAVLLPVQGPERAASAAISDVLEGYTPDLWHVHQHRSPFGMAAMVLLRTLGQNIVATDLGWVTPWDTRGFRVGDLADAVVAISDYAASLEATRSPSTVIRGGVRSDVRAGDDASGDGILFVGRLLPHKGALDLVRAMPAGQQLVVAGAAVDSGYTNAIEKVCRNKGFAFMPDASDDEVLAERHRAAVGVVPTQRGQGNEYMGLAALEMLAVGKPVVAMDSGGLREFVNDGINGIIAPDIESLVDAAITLSLDPHRRQLYTASSRTAAREFCCHNVARQLDAVYQTVGGGAHETSRHFQHLASDSFRWL